MSHLSHAAQRGAFNGRASWHNLDRSDLSKKPAAMRMQGWFAGIAIERLIFLATLKMNTALY
jgi:hypothetical protein